jgi:membrane peptidoglycan carboxypeptidase
LAREESGNYNSKYLFRILGGMIIRILSYCLVLVALFIGWSAWLYISVPVEKLRDRITYYPPNSDQPREAGLGLPDNVTLEEMPITLIFATIAAEDPYFAVHSGIKIDQIYSRVKGAIILQRRLPGGSTLTQQLAKNMFTDSKRTFYRKYKEAIYALRIEEDFTKEEIFTLYVNMAETGPSIYGFNGAAQFYFNKPVSKLDDVESMFIVSNLRSPTKYSAWFREHVKDIDAFRRVYETYWKTQMTMEGYDAQNILMEDKKTLFTHSMSDPNKVVQFPRKVPNHIKFQGRRDTEGFLLKYWQDNPQDIGIPSKKKKADKSL